MVLNSADNWICERADLRGFSSFTLGCCSIRGHRSEWCGCSSVSHMKLSQTYGRGKKVGAESILGGKSKTRKKKKKTKRSGKVAPIGGGEFFVSGEVEVYPCPTVHED